MKIKIIYDKLHNLIVIILPSTLFLRKNPMPEVTVLDIKKLNLNSLDCVKVNIKQALECFENSENQDIMVLYKLYKLENSKVMQKSLQDIIVLFFERTQNKKIATLEHIYKNIISEKTHPLKFYREWIKLLNQSIDVALYDIENFIFSYECQHYNIIISDSLILLAKLKHGTPYKLTSTEIETVIINLTSNFCYSFDDQEVTSPIDKKDINKILIRNLKQSADLL